eukprot:g22220.t1
MNATHQEPLKKMPLWQHSVDGMQVHADAHHVGGLDRSLGCISNCQAVLPALSSTTSRATSMLRASAYLHQYERYGLSREEMSEAILVMLQVQHDYEQLSTLELPPRFTLDLRKPAHTRWDGAVDLILSKHPYEESFLPVFQEHNKSLFDQLNASHFDALGKAVSSHYPETALELQGIAQQFAARGFPVTFEYLSAWLYFHELAHSDVVQKLDARECTGIVAETADGSIMQLANMDQSPLAARNLTLRISVVDDKGEPLFEGWEAMRLNDPRRMAGVDWYTLLSTGVSRAVKRGVASVQENWRSTDPVRKLDAIMADIQRLGR